jgi:hypothetical protein
MLPRKRFQRKNISLRSSAGVDLSAFQPFYDIASIAYLDIWNDAGMRSECSHLVRHRFNRGSSSSLVDDSGDLGGRFLDSPDVDIEAVEDKRIGLDGRREIS